MSAATVAVAKSSHSPAIASPAPAIQRQSIVGVGALQNVATPAVSLIYPQNFYPSPLVPPYQMKLEVGKPGDKFEQEADRMADSVVRMHDAVPPLKEGGLQRQSGLKLQKKHDEKQLAPASFPQHSNMTPVSRMSAPTIQRLVSGNVDGRGQHEAFVMAKSESGQLQASADLQQNVYNSKGGGNALPRDIQSSFGAALGADLSNVKVHTGSNAVQMNKQLGAHAFTHGSDIYFNTGKYDPSSRSGKHLLAHELTHTVQQGGSVLRSKKQDDNKEGSYLRTGTPSIQAAWYNVNIPFTNYQFDPSIRGIKNAANIAKDTVVAGFDWIVDEIKGLISAGKDWLVEKWGAIQELAWSGFEALKNSFTDITSFIKNPFNFLANAIINFDAGLLATAWAAFTGIVNKVWMGFKLLTGKLLQQVNKLWEKIDGYATWLLNKVSGLVNNFLFKRLPSALQKIANGLIETIKSLWKSINDGWKFVFKTIQTWVDSALATIERFVRRVISFAINTIIESIRLFGKLVFFLQDLFANPKKYISILAEKSVKAFTGLENRFAGIVSQYFGGFKNPSMATAMTGAIQNKSISGSTTEVKRSASWGEIGSGIWEMMGKKWQEFKSNPWGIVTGLLMDMVLPIVGNVKDIIKLFKDIKKIVTGPLSAGSLDELWTSFLQILDIPILIYHTVVSILMRTLMLPLIVATFIPHPIVKGIAAAVGYALLGAFVQAELLNIGHKILLLKTGSTSREQKQEAYNRVADSLIAMAMAAAIVVIMLILHFIANIMKGIFNFVKGKVFGIEKAPVEVKSPTEEIKLPKDEIKTPKDEAKVPKDEAKVPKDEAKVPKDEAKVPKDETKAPKDEAKVPKKNSRRAKLVEKTKERLEKLDQEKLANQEKINELNDQIFKGEKTLRELKEKVMNSTGEARAKAREELRSHQEELNGLKDERLGYIEERTKLNDKEAKLLETLELERPPLRESTKRTIENAAPKTADGKYIDPHRPNKTIDGPWDYGHKYGYENRRLILEATEKGMSQGQFNDWVNSHPEWFQIESRADNISHVFEKKGVN